MLGDKQSELCRPNSFGRVAVLFGHNHHPHIFAVRESSASRVPFTGVCVNLLFSGKKIFFSKSLIAVPCQTEGPCTLRALTHIWHQQKKR